MKAPMKAGGANAPGARALSRAMTKLDKALDDLREADQHLGVHATPQIVLGAHERPLIIFGYSKLANSHT